MNKSLARDLAQCEQELVGGAGGSTDLAGGLARLFGWQPLQRLGECVERFRVDLSHREQDGDLRLE